MGYKLLVNKVKSGFTILESVIVLGIIVVIVGMSIPLLSRFSQSSSINSASNNISSILRTARSYAISRNNNYSVNFDTASVPNAVWISDSLGNIVGRRHNLPKTVSIANITFQNNIVTFRPTGGISGNSGSVSLTDSGGLTKQITVINTTGRVKIN